MKPFFVIVIVLLIVIRSGAGDPVTATRLPYGGTWAGKVGIIDVDPTTYTKHGSTLATSSTASDINTAIAAAAAAGGSRYVELASGTFTIGADISMTSSGVELRGQTNANGIPSTILNFTSGANSVNMRTATWDTDAPGQYTTRQISSGHTRGSTTLTLASAPTGLAAGTLMIVVAPESAPTVDGSGGFTDFLPTTGNYPFSQIVKVTGVSGNDVTFSPAINADYISGLTCHVYFRAAASQINYSGLKNLHLRVGGGTGFFNGQAVYINGANQCWFHNCFFQGIGVVTSLNAFIFFYVSYNCEIFKCKFYACSDPGNSGLYSISSLHTSGLLVHNSEFTDTSNVYPILSTSGLVFAYNYCHDMNYGASLSQWVFFHGSHSHYNLLEGNFIQGQHYNDLTDSDNFTHSRNTLYFRERIASYDNSGNTSGFPLNNVNAIVAQDHQDNITVAGCVMGTTGKGTGVTGGNGGPQGENEGYIYNFHTDSIGLEKWGNYNTFDAGIPAGEVLSGGNALVNSYYLSSRPSWFGTLTWPWVDPVSTGTSLASTAWTNFPAGYRAAFGVDPPSGSGGGSSPVTSVRRPKRGKGALR